MSARSGIQEAIVTLFKTVDGTGDFRSNLYGNVSARLMFWDEVSDYPYVCVGVGTETREYLPGGFKWGNISYIVRVYIHEEHTEVALEDIFEDLETLVDNNLELQYDKFNPTRVTQDIRISSITSDEGVLAPHGVGEIILDVLYEKIN
jgi:hypothetical protein